MIRFVIIIFAIVMLFQKIFQVIKKSIEKYKNNAEKHFFNVQLATTNKEKEIGLMYVKEMPVDTGMLFEYHEDTYPSMWMKNTEIPLDAIFIDTNAKVVHIERNMKPHSRESRKSPKLCKYALEINGGLSDKMGIKIGHLIGTTVTKQDITDFKPNQSSNKNKNNTNKNNTKDSSKKNKNNKNKNNTKDSSKKNKNNTNTNTNTNKNKNKNKNK